MLRTIISAAAIMVSLFVNGQRILEIQPNARNDASRVYSLVSDNSIWANDDTKGWEKLPVTGLPANAKFSLMSSFSLVSMSRTRNRVIVSLSDNTLWWYDDTQWQALTLNGLPPNARPVLLKGYMKYGAMGGAQAKIIVLLEDQSMYSFQMGNKKWMEVKRKGLPDGRRITALTGYPKSGLMGITSRMVALLDDNSVHIAVDGGNWQPIAYTGLPANAKIKFFDSFMKHEGLTTSGRLVAVTDDNKLWFLGGSSKEWQPLEKTGLPQTTNITDMTVYQKYEVLSGETNILILLDDTSIWYYTEKEKWKRLK